MKFETINRKIKSSFFKEIAGLLDASYLNMDLFTKGIQPPMRSPIFSKNTNITLVTYIIITEANC